MSDYEFYGTSTARATSVPSRKRDEVEPTYAEYVEWKKSFHARMDRLKESQMSARALVQSLQQLGKTDGYELPELMVLASQAQSLRATYENNAVSAPEWLVDANATLTADIQARNRRDLELRLRELEQAEVALRTPGERRAEISKEREKIQKALGRPTEQPAEPVGASS